MGKGTVTGYVVDNQSDTIASNALHYGAAAPFREVIMDEFHYYSDRERGVAWQVPLLTMAGSRFLLMSATLGATDFFGITRSGFPFSALPRRSARETALALARFS